MRDDLTKAATLVKDPVCGMNVDSATAKLRLEHAGETYYFCCGQCAEKFNVDPEKYLAQHEHPSSSSLVTLGAPAVRTGPPRQTSPAPAGPTDAPSAKSTDQANYVCPMCTEVRASKPGPCPSCGMALERETPVTGMRTEYTCPMHPEIVRPGPGSCPICGMALEPRTAVAEEEENPELVSMTRRFWVSVALTIPVLLLGMSEMIPSHAAPQLFSART